MSMLRVRDRARTVDTKHGLVGQIVDAHQATAAFEAEALAGNLGSRQLLLSASASTREQENQLAALYSGLRTPLGTYLSSIGLPVDRSDDVIQESFVRLLRHQQNTAAAAALRGERATTAARPENLRGWLFRVAHNLAMDAYRDHDRITERLRDENEDEVPVLEFRDPARNPEQGLLYQERMSRLRRAVSRLTPQQRTCVLLRAQGKRYREIAVSLGISTQRAANLLQRGKLRLAGEL